MSEIDLSVESAKKLIENEPIKHEVFFDVAGKRLEGMIVESPQKGPFDILLIGGGGHIPHEDYYGAWQNELVGIGVNSMSFDFRGVGASEGELSESGLDTRLEDARAAVDYFKKQGLGRNLYIMGVSMGGTIAIQLANEVQADGLVLAAPAAYSEEARHKLFGPEFSAAIRKEGSWENSPDFYDLEQFEGKVLLVHGDKDSVVPAPILHQYDEVSRKKGTVLVIPGAGHRFMRQGDPESIMARQEVLASLEIIAS
jgi:alpha/beta superfamily hydrolase